MRTLVVYCHPVPESFCAALRDTAVAALRARGDEVRLIDLYAEGFQPVMMADERRSYNDGAPSDAALAAHIDHLRWAEAILLIYPTWWYGRPPCSRAGSTGSGQRMWPFRWRPAEPSRRS